MRLLLDTQMLLWVTVEPRSGRMPGAARDILGDASTVPHFSAASIWEVSIKHARGKPDFDVPPARLRSALLGGGYAELSITSKHAADAGALPVIHRDPFDRMLVAQAMAEGITLLTADRTVAEYPGDILLAE